MIYGAVQEINNIVSVAFLNPSTKNMSMSALRTLISLWPDNEISQIAATQDDIAPNGTVSLWKAML